MLSRPSTQSLCISLCNTVPSSSSKLCKTITLLLLLLSKQRNAMDLLLRRRMVILAWSMLCGRKSERCCKLLFRSFALSKLLNKDDQVFVMLGMMLLLLFKNYDYDLAASSVRLLAEKSVLGRGSGGQTDGQQHSLVPFPLPHKDWVEAVWIFVLYINDRTRAVAFLSIAGRVCGDWWWWSIVSWLIKLREPLWALFDLIIILTGGATSRRILHGKPYSLFCPPIHFLKLLWLFAQNQCPPGQFSLFII